MIHQALKFCKKLIVYTVCASIASLPYYGVSNAATSEHMRSAAQKANEMRDAALTDMRRGMSSMGMSAAELAPQSNINPSGKGMTVEEVQGLMGLKDDSEFQKKGNARITDLESRYKTAGADDPEAAAYGVLKGAGALPKGQITSNDPIFKQTNEIVENPGKFANSLGSCQAMSEFMMQDRVVHEPIYEQCTQVVDKTGTCVVDHKYNFVEPISHVSGPYNIANCGEGCVNVWLGNPDDNVYQTGKSCHLFENSIKFRVNKAKAVRKVTMKNIVWDDHMELFIRKAGGSSSKLLMLPWAGAFPQQYNTSGNQMPEFVYRYASESGDPWNCEQNTSWHWDTELDITHHFKDLNDGDVVEFYMRLAVYNGGEGYIKLQIDYDPGSILEGDEWSPPGCMEMAQAVGDGFARGQNVCLQMPAGAEGNCMEKNGYKICEGRFANSPIPGISPFCQKVSVTADYAPFYQGDMECYQAADGTLQCPKNTGGVLDGCKSYAESGCAFIKGECTEGALGQSGNCYVYTNTYDCGYDQKVSSPIGNKGIECQGEIACLGEDCVTQEYTSSTDFTRAAALLNVAQQASKDMVCEGAQDMSKDVNCTLFSGDEFSCKIAVGGVQDCCDVPTSVNLMDYLELTFALYKADSALMSLKTETLTGEAVKSVVGSYQTLHNSTIGVVKEGMSSITEPLTNYISNITGEVGEVFSSINTYIEAVKTYVRKAMEQLLKTMIEKMGISSSLGGAVGGAAGGAAGSMADASAQDLAQYAGEDIIEQAFNKSAYEAGEKTAAQAFAQGTSGQAAGAFVEALGTVVSVVGYVYLAYQIAMMVIQMVYKCENKEFELASNRALRQCHYIGSYCKSKVLGVCIEKRQSYCCYKSPLGRILQEQIRNQLHIGFGSAKNPQCLGISVEDFGKVDWDKVNLDEWIAMTQEAGFNGGDINKYSMDGLTGAGSSIDYKGDRLNAEARAQKRMEGVQIQEIHDAFAQTYVMPGAGADMKK